MSRIVYINGCYVRQEEARISIFDRGLLFADSVYEVCGVVGGRLVDFDSHMQRLFRSLREMRIGVSMEGNDILAIMRKLIQQNRVGEGLVYLQVTRGNEGDRDFVPSKVVSPTVFAFTQMTHPDLQLELERGFRMKSEPDIRWGRRDIKTVGLMGSVLSKWTAEEAGADEVLMYQDGYVTEGGATSFFLIKDGAIVTRPLSNDVLSGCTRHALLDLAAAHSLQLKERLFTVKEAYESEEAFITGASIYVCPVVEIDAIPIGDRKPGPLTRTLQRIYLKHARESAI